MEIGFEVTAARPKGLRAEEPAPASSMRGDRKITKNISTDQKKIRRAQQRKTASMDFYSAMNDVGDCRICGGNLVPRESQKGDTGVRASCEDCNTTHMLQGGEMQRSAAMREQVDGTTLQRLATVCVWDTIESKMPCPNCGSQGWGSKQMGGHSAGNSGDGSPSWRAWHVRCKDCDSNYKVKESEAEQWRREHNHRHGSKGDFHVLQMLGYHWMPMPSTDKYLGGQPLSAIARRAQSVSSTTEENL